MILVPNCLLKSLKSILELRRFNTTRHMPLCAVIDHQDKLPILQDQNASLSWARKRFTLLASECFTVVARAGQEAKVEGLGVIDGPQITTNTGIKDKAFIGAAFVVFIAVKLK